MSGDPGSIDSGQVVDCLEGPDRQRAKSASSRSSALPPQCSVHATPGTGTNAVFPVYKLVSAVVCGYHFEQEQQRTRLATDADCCSGNRVYPSAGATRAGNENNYFVVQVHQRPHVRRRTQESELRARAPSATAACAAPVSPVAAEYLSAARATSSGQSSVEVDVLDVVALAPGARGAVARNAAAACASEVAAADEVRRHLRAELADGADRAAQGAHRALGGAGGEVVVELVRGRGGLRRQSGQAVTGLDRRARAPSRTGRRGAWPPPRRASRPRRARRRSRDLLRQLGTAL